MNLFRNIFLVLGAPASCRYKMFDSFTFFVPHAETQRRRGRDILRSQEKHLCVFDGIFRVSSFQCSVFRKNRQDASAPIGYILCVFAPLREGIFRVSSFQCSVFRKNRQDAGAPIGNKLCDSAPLREGIYRVSSFQFSVFRKNRQDASAPIGKKLCAFKNIKRICVNLQNLRINILFNSQLLHRLLNTQRARLAL